MSRDVDLMIERLERLKEKALSPTAAHLDGMPHSGSFMGDSVGLDVIKIEQLENKIREKIVVAAAYQNEIEAAVDLITGKKSAEMRLIIRSRYLDGSTWNEVNEILFGSKEDFREREESYLRRTNKTHARALETLETLANSGQFQILRGKEKTS